jgi:predicted RNA-binding protein with TRAM domain
VEVIEASTALQNQSNEVEVTEISRKGDGIAPIQGFVIFIKNGKVGQKVKVKVEQVGNRFAIATTSDLA